MWIRWILIRIRNTVFKECNEFFNFLAEPVLFKIKKQGKESTLFNRIHKKTVLEDRGQIHRLFASQLLLHVYPLDFLYTHLCSAKKYQ
jgi:hypothetical protein